MTTASTPELTPNIELKNLVSRELVLQYCQDKGIQGVSSMLRKFTEMGIADFVNYLSQKGFEGLGIVAENQKVLLHGSDKLISVFEPKVSTGGGNSNKEERLVYATEDSEYAIFMAITHQRGGTYGISYKQTGFTCYVDLTFINGPSTLEPGYVYIFNREGFEQVGNHEFTTSNQTGSLLAIPVEPEDLITPITIRKTYTTQ